MASDQKSEAAGDRNDAPDSTETPAPLSLSEFAADPVEPPKDDAPEENDPPQEPPRESVPPQKPERGGTFLPALLGGVFAALIGFVAGKAGILDPLLPPGWRTPDPTAQIATLEDRLAEQSGEIGTLRSRLDGIAIPDIAPLGSRIDDIAGDLKPISSEISALASDISELESRLSSLEKRPINEGVSQAAIDAYERELTRMKETLAAQREEVEGFIAQARNMEIEADRSRQTAAQRNALTRLQTALIEGAPYAPVLEELRTSGLDVPPGLADQADRGVTTLAALRAEFPDAAREALADAREAGKGDNPGFSSFLARQFGARSVAPRAGDDPDAILSRAEAAVTDGRIDTALVELEALPEAAKPALAGWMAAASRRQAAMKAADAMAQTLGSN